MTEYIRTLGVVDSEVTSADRYKQQLGDQNWIINWNTALVITLLLMAQLCLVVSVTNPIREQIMLNIAKR